MPRQLCKPNSGMHQSRLDQACGLHARHRIHHGVIAQMTDDNEVNEKDIAYSEKYDAYYNQRTNEWIDDQCCDPDCEFCRRRPARPLVDQ